MTASLVDVRDLSAGYGERQILTDISFSIAPGELVSLFGPNGTGKSTLFRCLMGRLRHQGTVRLGDVPAGELSVAERAKKVAHVPQDHGAAFPISALDVVLLGRTPYLQRHRGPRRQDAEVAMQALETVGIGRLARDLYTQLSGGQRQLVLLARALAQQAPLLLLDEPTASLDYGNQRLVWNVVTDIAESGRGVLICTHDPHPVRRECDRALVLGRAGTFLADGPPTDVLTATCLNTLYPNTTRG